MSGGHFRPCIDCMGRGEERTERGDFVLCDRCAGSCTEWHEGPSMRWCEVENCRRLLSWGDGEKFCRDCQREIDRMERERREKEVA